MTSSSDAHNPGSDLDAALAPGLYIVATPIGNLNDITLRAVDVLRRCDGVACEDTRVTGKLMKHLGLSKPLWRYNDHADERDRARLVESMETRAVALVSDAGTPLISDPGYRLVNAAREAGVAGRRDAAVRSPHSSLSLAAGSAPSPSVRPICFASAETSSFSSPRISDFTCSRKPSLRW